MDNPLSRLVPNLFGEYPNSFIKLVDIVSANSDLEREELTPLLWKAYEFGDIHHEGQKRRSGKP
jgi:hypothetical protein